MAFVITENCIRCKYQDCVEVCPVDCFYEGENCLVIHPGECIDCAVCVPECNAEAILPDSDPVGAEWVAFNEKYAKLWPNITAKGKVPDDADEWRGIESKMKEFSPKPASR